VLSPRGRFVFIRIQQRPRVGDTYGRFFIGDGSSALAIGNF